MTLTIQIRIGATTAFIRLHPTRRYAELEYTTGYISKITITPVGREGN